MVDWGNEMFSNVNMASIKVCFIASGIFQLTVSSALSH